MALYDEHNIGAKGWVHSGLITTQVGGKCMKVTLPDFRRAGVLVVGDVMLDRYWYGPTCRISPEAPVPVVKVDTIEERPGGAANVAMNIASPWRGCA